MGAAGERIAVWWLTTFGLDIETRNLAVDGGEIDIVARDGASRVVVEVRTITGPGDPIDAVGRSKRAHVASLAAQVGARRVDFVGVALRADAIEVHWVPG
ncbi:MAG: YraN family protein [Acidimicrobiia bacterium]